MSAVMTNNQLLRTENRLAASMQRLSSGLKINSASDNPAGLAICNKMKAQIDALDRAESNATDATSVLQIADGALGEVTSIIQRMRELSVQAANGTYSYDDRKTLQAEIDELQVEVDRISKDTEYNTKTLLDGSSDVRVYGKDATRYYVSDTVLAQTYSLNVTEVGTQATVQLDYKVPSTEGVININGVNANIISGMSQEAYLHEIRTAAAEAGCSVSVTEDNKLFIQSDYFGYDETIQVVMTTELAQDVGVTENDDCEYVVNANTMVFGPEAPGIDGTIRIDGVEITITADMKKEEYYEELRDAAERNGYTATVEPGGKMEIRAESISQAEFIQFSFSNNMADALNIKAQYKGEYQVNTTGTDAKVEVPNNKKLAGLTDTTTVVTEGNRVTVTDNNGFEIDFLLNSGFDASVQNEESGNFQIEVTDIGSMTIQIGANEHQTMDIRIAEVSSASLYIDNVDIAVANGADRAMVTLDEALAKLSATRSRIGAFQNRLDYASSSLAQTGENVTAAYSGLMDTDMAEEMTAYTQQNILNQAAISVLAQANELPQQVLSLLQ